MSTSSPETSSTSKTYHGTCHCKAIRFTATLPEALYPEGTGKVLRCNCSICTKNGYFLVYPLRHDVAFGPGCEEKLKSYLMGLKTKPHRFCPECSSSILIDFENSTLEKERKFLAVNAAMFTDFDLDKAEIQTFDGRERLGPKYEA